MSSDDRNLMARAALGDVDAFALLADRYRSRLERLGHVWLHGGAEAEDVAQETLARAFQQVRSYRGEADPGTWLNAIAINVCHHWHRAGRRHRYVPDPSLLERDKRAESGPGDGLPRVLRREADRQLRRALDCLTDAQRDAFLLHYMEDHPHEAVARILKTTTQAVRALCLRARRALRRRLAPLHMQTA